MAITIAQSKNPRSKVPEASLGWGKHFTDHMFIADYDRDHGWHNARILPYGPLSLEPAAAVLHYGQAMFEGLKAFARPDGRVQLFRPERHCQRMHDGAPRLCMEPPPIALMMEGIQTLVALDSAWVPRGPGTALYLRPTLFATERFLGVRPANAYIFVVIASPVGTYFGTQGVRPVKIWVETKEIRAARGGLGAIKAGANYAASLHAAHAAKQAGYDQVLWLDARDHETIEEVGTMNLFVRIEDTLVTPPLSDSILSGVTRDSILTLARDLGFKVQERPLSVKELRAANKAGTLREVFGTGTAAIITPVVELAIDADRLTVGDGKPGAMAHQLFEELTGIQRGTKTDKFGWMFPVEPLSARPALVSAISGTR